MPPGRENNEGWDEYRLLVLKELSSFEKWLKSLTETQNAMLIELSKLNEIKEKLDALYTRLDAMENKQQNLESEIAGLKVKSGIWGLIAGAIPAGIALLAGTLYLFFAGK